MKPRAIELAMAIGLLAAALPLSAGGGEQPAQDQTIDDLRAEMQQARTELAEAARRMAEIQRQMAGDHGGTALAWAFEPGDGAAQVQLEKIVERLGDWGTMPPRIGVLLGRQDDGDPRTVVGLTPGGGAEAAGIRRGDVVVSINGRALAADAVDDVRDLLEGVEPGDTVVVEVLRDGEEHAFDVETDSAQRDIRVIVRRLEDMSGLGGELRALAFHGAGAARRPGAPPAPGFPLLPHLAMLGADADLVANHPGLSDYFGTGEGVLVLRIDADNAFGLDDGDVILTVDREPVPNPMALGRLLLARDAGDRVRIEVMRDGVLTELEGTVPERPDHAGRLQRIHFRAPEPPQPATGV